MPAPRREPRLGLGVIGRKGAVLPHFVPIFAALCVAYLLDGNVEGNELDTLSLALHRLDPGFIAGDFRLSLPSGVRLPFQMVLSPLLRVLPLAGVSIVGRLGLYALLAGALGRLAAKLDLGVAETLIAGGLYAVVGQDIAAGEWMIGALESKSLAYACVLWGLEGALDQRWTRASACLGLAFTFHPLVGMWSTLAAALALSAAPRAPRSAFIGAAPAFLLTASPGLLLAGQWLGDSDPSTALGRWVYVYFRHPHHLCPEWFLNGAAPCLRLGVAMASGAVSCKVPFQTVAQRTMARFARATLAILVLGLLVGRLPHAEWFLSTYPFRVGDTLFPLVGFALVVQQAFQGRTSGLARDARVVGVVAAGVLCFVALSRDLAEREARDRTPVRAAYAWVREHTPVDALVLCSPALDYAGLLMGRPTVASARAVPTAPRDVAAWYRRLVDLNGGQAPRSRGFPAFQELDGGFEALSPKAIDALARRYHARYLLRRSDPALPYEALYDDGRWAVFRLK